MNFTYPNTKTNMRIERELRMAINAAARAQQTPTYNERQEAEKRSVKAFLKANPALTKKVEAARKRYLTSRAKTDALEQSSAALLKGTGLRFTDRSGHELEVGFGNKSQELFVASGGVLPPVEKREWKADEVISRLAAADKSERDAILKDYGIKWSD